MGAVRHRFEHQGRTIYEWQQTLTEVEVFIQVKRRSRRDSLGIPREAPILRNRRDARVRMRHRMRRETPRSPRRTAKRAATLRFDSGPSPFGPRARDRRPPDPIKNALARYAGPPRRDGPAPRRAARPGEHEHRDQGQPSIPLVSAPPPPRATPAPRRPRPTTRTRQSASPRVGESASRRGGEAASGESATMAPAAPAAGASWAGW